MLVAGMGLVIPSIFYNSLRLSSNDHSTRPRLERAHDEHDRDDQRSDGRDADEEAERRGLLNFRHRVALQMSEDESLTFVRSRKAAQLQSEGPSPVAALYLDVENDQTLRFKPYSIESTIDFNKQLEQIGQTISTWSKPK